MREPISLVVNGTKFRAVGSRLFCGPADETFHEFCMRVVCSEFSDKWYQDEKRKPEAERHTVATWYLSYCDLTRTHSRQNNKSGGSWSSPPSGDAWSLITLGYDLFVVCDNTKLPDELRCRLRNLESFQGARYELAVAATFARAGFDLQFAKSKARKHCEFTAISKDTGEIVAVEAKSRHRPGVLHQDGEPRPIEDIKVGVRRMLNQALQQAPTDLPFLVFIDLNLPASASILYPKRVWWKDMMRPFQGRPKPSPASPEEFTILYLTNFSYYYAGRHLIRTTDFSSDIGRVIPKYPKNPFKHHSSFNTIDWGVSSYGHVPHGW